MSQSADWARTSTVRPRRSLFRLAAIVWLSSLSFLVGTRALWGEASDAGALAAVKLAVAAELRAEKTDTTAWQYHDHDAQPGKDARYEVIETPKGDLRRMLELNGKPLTGSAEAKELERLRAFVGDTEEQARRAKMANTDGAQAREFLAMLPNAFVWSPVSETPQTVTLKFRPNPGFVPPDAQSRVLGVMAGEMVIAREANRIASLRGTLTDDVKFGLGLFGKIDKGGTFNVERREIAPGKWQITESHIHIGGHALLFKTIGQQEDEAKTDWHLSTAPDLQTALQQITK